MYLSLGSQHALASLCRLQMERNPASVNKKRKLLQIRTLCVKLLGTFRFFTHLRDMKAAAAVAQDVRERAVSCQELQCGTNV